MTRLLVKLQATAESRYEMEYHKDIQGLIYSLLKDSDYNCHDKKGYKFFTYSNVFPWGYVRKNDIRNLIIASPNEGMISYLKEQLEYLHEIRIGAMNFKTEYCNKISLQVPDNTQLITGTPILCNIHKYRIVEAGAAHLVNGFKATYWRNSLPVDLFLNQVGANLQKKYNSYHNEESDIETDHIFYKSRFMKQVAIPLSMGEGRYRPTVIGSCWSFGFTNPDMARFALDVGLGELNSLGFGFMNPMGSN